MAMSVLSCALKMVMVPARSAVSATPSKLRTIVAVAVRKAQERRDRQTDR